MNESPLVNGVKYSIRNSSDVIQQTLANGQQWNDEVLQIIRNYICTRNLKHFLNIGCHIGSIALPVSMCIDKVTAIEAYPPTYSHLSENIRINGVNNITTLNVALGNKDGEEVFFMSEDKVCPVEHINRIANNSGGMAVFTEDDITHNYRSAGLTDRKLSNKMYKLDSLDIDEFDIVLIDVEGLEHDVLLGATAQILKNRPIIIIEIWDDGKMTRENMKMRRADVINLILSLNYTLVRNIADDFIFEPK